MCSSDLVVSSAWMRAAAKTAPDHVHERHKGCRGCAHPVCEHPYIEIDAFALIDVTLTIKLQMQVVFGEQDMGKELGPCAPARNRGAREPPVG